MVCFVVNRLQCIVIVTLFKDVLVKSKYDPVLLDRTPQIKIDETLVCP